MIPLFFLLPPPAFDVPHYGPAVPLQPYLVLSLVLFGIGIYGAITRRNLITILMSLELMLNGVNLMLVAFSRQWGLSLMRQPFSSEGFQSLVPVPVGQVFVIFSLTIAVAEAGIGLAMVYYIFKSINSVEADRLNLFKW
ncbi:NADH-quinone oxidoreductase subunit NuoK [bacterium]|nr:NADH-quinone oxidoreductase subunit NuoK [bacterium]